MKQVRCFYYYNTNRNKEIFQLLLKYANASRNMYNKMLYYFNQNYDILEESLSKYDIAYMFRKLEIPKWFPDDSTFDMTLNMHYTPIQSFFGAIIAFNKSPSKFHNVKPQMPHFLPKTQKYYNFASRRVKINDRTLIIGRKTEPQILVQIPKPQFDEMLLSDGSTDKTMEGKLRQVRFIFITKHCFKIEIIYDKAEIIKTEYNTNYIGIDLGLNNFAAIISTLPELNPIILCGKLIKSVNQWHNKQTAKFKSILDYSERNKDFKNRYYLSKQLKDIIQMRNKKIFSIMHKYSTYIINYCKLNNIHTIVVGVNKEWKQKIDLGKQTNQKFVQIPFFVFRNQLQYKCELEGLQYIEIEESYTSKTDHLAYEKMFVFGKCPKNYKFMGTRSNRGLFQSSTGKLLNADINGAIGILRKKLGDSIIPNFLNSNKIYNPIRVNISELD